MTRKDYQLIASALKESYYGVSDRDDWRKITKDMAKALASDNPAFNREMFLKACGI